ncbi:MAG: hypothetical protein PHU31_02565 [Anaerotignum sp.]|nr:hypothetical protein [Anaerotignum sp.]
MTREYFEELFKYKLLEKAYDRFEQEFASGEYHSEEDAVDAVIEEIVKG